jgi:tetratricopeptide (TPR) repeat protein
VATGGAAAEIEGPVRLSDSPLWSLQRRFFEAGGIDSWRKGIVPHYITSNPGMAWAYARIVHGYLRDAAASGGGEGVYHIVELGSGSGRFAFHFLRAFAGLMARSPLGRLRWRYVMTDVSEATLGFWRINAWLKPYVDEGLLDFALFDVESGETLHLVESGETLAPGASGNGRPLTVIANYVFDGVRTDCFAVRDGALHEVLVGLAPTDPGEPFETNADGLPPLDQVEAHFEERPLDGPAYDDPVLNGILDDYRQRFGGAQILFPVAAFRCIRHLAALSSGRMMLLTADKGDSREWLLNRDRPPYLARHGSFSLMVNYHAIGRFVETLGGRALQTAHNPVGLQIGAYLLGADENGHAETELAFHEAVERASPDDLFQVMRAMPKAGEAIGIDEILAAVRLSGYDGQVFHGFGERLSEIADALQVVDREELRWTMAEVWRNYYFIGDALDLPFHLGAMSLLIQIYDDALAYFRRSLDLFGPDASTYANIAIAQHRLGQTQAAMDAVTAALAINPSHPMACTLRLTLEEESRRRPLPAGGTPEVPKESGQSAAKRKPRSKAAVAAV